MIEQIIVVEGVTPSEAVLRILRIASVGTALPKQPFDRVCWQETLAQIEGLGKSLPSYPARTFTTDDFYPDEG